MLVIDENSVYEIDEECLAKRGAPMNCGTMQKLEEKRKKAKAKRDVETMMQRSDIQKK